MCTIIKYLYAFTKKKLEKTPKKQDTTTDIDNYTSQDIGALKNWRQSKT